METQKVSTSNIEDNQQESIISSPIFVEPTNTKPTEPSPKAQPNPKTLSSTPSKPTLIVIKSQAKEVKYAPKNVVDLN